MKTLAIYGAGGQGRETLDLARAINNVSHVWSNIIFLNDSPADRTLNNASVLTLAEFRATCPPDQAEAVVAVGEPETRAILAAKLLVDGYNLATLIHPLASVGENAEIAQGAIISYDSFISCNTKIGLNALIQPHTSISHDSIVGDHSVISSFSCLAGHVTIGSRTYIGLNVPIREGVSVGSQSIVGMGSNVLHDIPDNVRAFGNPIHTIKENVSKRVFH